MSTIWASIQEKRVLGKLGEGGKGVYFPAGLEEIFLTRCNAVCTCRPCETPMSFTMAWRPCTSKPPSCWRFVCNPDSPHYQPPDMASLCPKTFNSCLISWIIRKAKGIPILCLLHSEIVGLYRCTYWNKWVSNVIKFMQSLHFKYDRPHFFFFACTLEALLSQANIFHYPNQTMANLIVKGPE